ncbi:IclR family transcriptional regulator [Rhodoligotrophos ferricapiens]|uniref:IclR family transcriptional regulator n=1 Tax=Rhodoligotrophos ferricapiens TaxID=3069264 RepID=UPI00315D1172
MDARTGLVAASAIRRCGTGDLMPRTSARKAPASEAASGSAAAGTLARGLAIMDLLLQARQPMTLAEIGDSVDLDHSTTLRLLRSLEDLRQVIRIGQGRKYVCSPKALRPLPLLHPLEQLRRESAPMLYGFSTEVGATAVLVIYLGTERLVAQVATSPGTLNPYYNAWLAGPLHGSGPGKALLLSLSPAQRRELVGAEPFKAYTEHTIRTWEALDADLQESAARGYVLVRDEYYLGLSAMACNFCSVAGNTVGCIALTGHTRDFTPEWIAQSSTKLKNLTRLIPMQIGSLSLIDTLCGR